MIKGEKHFLRKQWRLFSDEERITQAMSRYSVDPDAGSNSFIQCRGKFAKESSQYPRLMAETFWNARFASSERRCARALAAPTLSSPTRRDEGHRQHDSALTSRPFWSMFTRVVQIKSPEANCDGARKAIDTERGKMGKRGVWDTSDVYSLRDLYKTPNFSECMLGRVFQIIGIKSDELAGRPGAHLEGTYRASGLERAHQNGDTSNGVVRRRLECSGKLCGSTLWFGSGCNEGIHAHAQGRRECISSSFDRHSKEDSHLHEFARSLVAQRLVL